MMNPDLTVNLLEQLPPWYREVLDYQEICKTEQAAFDALALEINTVGDDFFLQTMGAEAVALWEDTLGITPDLQTESLDFRRFRVLNRLSSRPPYTMAFLRQKLDEIIGPGKWTLTMDYANYTLYVESSAEDQQYSGELLVTIGKVKPAHIVFVNTPLIQDGILLSETITGAFTRWNYRLGNWALFSAPFKSTYEEEVIKVPETPSIQPQLLTDTATYLASDVASARINGAIPITGITKEIVAPHTLVVSYDVSVTQADTITKAELLSGSGQVLTAVSLYVSVGADGIRMKHKIPVKEGI